MSVLNVNFEAKKRRVNRNGLNKKRYAWLADKFERNIVYDAHGFIQKFSRSEAGIELARRGRWSLAPIIYHLENDCQRLGDNEIVRAWTLLLNRIEVRVDPKKTAPQDLANMKGWIKWAKKFAC